MSLPRLGGPGIGLNLTGALGSLAPTAPGVFSGASPSNAVTLPAGCVFIVPAGTYYIEPGQVTSLQFLDPVSQSWRTINSTPNAGGFNVDSDGGNIRLANLTGCVIGALITNSGTGMTNGIGTAATGLTITVSSGGSVWIPVVGGVHSTGVAVTTTGSNYSFAPQLVCSPPPAGGIQMTATCTVAGGSVSTVTVVNQGAGYKSAATILAVNDYRDTTGSGAVITPSIVATASGTLTAMYPSALQNAAFVDGVGGHGKPLTAVPTFTFSAGSTISATAIMNFCVTGLTVTGGGSGVPAGSMLVAMSGAIVSGTRATNVAGPIVDTGLTQPRPAWIQPSLNAGSVSTTGSVIVDPGFGFQAVPTLALINGTGLAGSSGISITSLVGGQSDTNWVQPF